MKSDIFLRVGPAVVRLNPSSEETAEFLRHRYSMHLSEAGGDEVLDIHFNAGLGFQNPTEFKVIADDSNLSAKSSAASLDWDFKTKRGTLEAANVYFYFPIENSLRILFSRILLSHEATLVHAAAVLGKGKSRAALFPGKSGAGKSTLAAAAVKAGATALGDDIIALYKKDDVWHAAGTPFAGVESPRPPNVHAPLGMIAFLGGRGKTELAAVSQIEASVSLAAAFPFSDAFRGASGKTALRLASEAAHAVGVARASYALGSDPTPLWIEL